MHTLYIAIFLLSLLGCSEQHSAHQNKEAIVTFERSYTDIFEYEILPATGSNEIVEKGNTAQLLINIPYLFTLGVFPPETVLNEILSKGISDAGMSGGARWKPYKIYHDDFELIFGEVKSLSKLNNLEYIEPDSWVKSFEDWNVWVMYIKRGIPWEEHKRLNNSVIVIEKELKEAEKNNNVDKINELHVKYVVEGMKLSEFIMRHMKYNTI